MPLFEFGRYTFYLALFAFVDGLVDFGSTSLVLQRGSTDDSAFAALLHRARRARLLLGSLAVCGLVATVALAREADAGWIALASVYPLTRFFEASSLHFQRAVSYGTPVLVRSVAATLRTATILVLATTYEVRSAGPLLAAHAGGVVLANLSLHLAARSRWPGKAPMAHELSLGRFLWLALPLALGGIAQQAYFYVDNLFVRAMLGDEELGRYNACGRLFSWLVMVAAFATSAALPWLARHHETRSLWPATRRLALPLMLSGTLASVALFFFAQDALGLVFGHEFLQAHGALRLLMGASICVFAGAPFLTALVAAGRNWQVAGITAFALLFNVTGNLYAIPRAGIEGAAAATFASEALILFCSILGLALISRESERETRTNLH